MPDTVNYEAQRGVRFDIDGDHSVELTVHSGNLFEMPCVYSGQLLDLAPTGAKLSVPAQITTGSYVRLQISVEDIALRFHVAGIVCWCRLGEDGTWLAGCSFNPWLPEGLFDRLASGGRVNRRNDPRLKQLMGLSGRWGLADANITANLHDYSHGGFSVVSKHAGGIGQRFHLFLPEPSNCLIVGESQWQLAVEDRYMIGFSFLNSKDFGRLEAFVNESDYPMSSDASERGIGSEGLSS